jgi:hypothetical protein
MAPRWITQPAGDLIPELAVWQRRLLLAGGAGLAVSAVGLVFEPRQFFQSYLMAFMWVLAVALGSLALAMVHQLSGGAWGVVIRRSMGAASRTLPFVALLFIPIAFGVTQLYPWTDAPYVASDPDLMKKAAYLNVPFFLARAGLYFLTWTGLSGVGLILYTVTISFASFDWLMSLEPHWYSTIFGVIILGGQGLSTFAFLILALAWLAGRPPMDAIATPDRFQDLGKLMLAFVMLWAYFAFSQWLIIWSGNLPDEILWYRHRLQSGWTAVAIVLILFHFAVPFALLLSRTLKRSARALAGLAAAVLVARLVDVYWLIAPDFHTAGVHVSWLDLWLPASMGALWLGLFVRQLRGRAIVPVHDPEFADAIDGLAGDGPQPAGSAS